MQIAISELMQKALMSADEKMPQSGSNYSPEDIRNGIQAFAAKGDMAMARALTDAGLSLYPESQDLLAMAGLMALANEDWGDAIELLQQLLVIQGADATAMTYRMLVRALRCNLEPARAQRILIKGLQRWPDDQNLQNEKDTFLEGPAVMPSPSMIN